MQLFHFSDNPGIEVFVPRPVLVPSARPEGRDWLNGPLVWAIEERHEFLYLFPRDCPRILIWATEGTSAEDRAAWLGDNRAVAFIEQDWLARVEACTIERYALPADGFEDLGDAGMWVSHQPVVPTRRESLSDLPNAFAPRGVELRMVDSLVPLKGLWGTSLHPSGIRLRNAKGWA